MDFQFSALKNLIKSQAFELELLFRRKELLGLNHKLCGLLKNNEIEKAQIFLQSMPYAKARRVVNVLATIPQQWPRRKGYVLAVNAATPEGISLLTKYEVNLSVLDSFGKSAAYTALEYDEAQKFRALINAGAPKEIHIKKHSFSITLLESLIDQTMRRSNTLKDLPESLICLAQNGVDMNTTFRSGSTALFDLIKGSKAVINQDNFVNCAKVLLSLGAKIDTNGLDNWSQRYPALTQNKITINSVPLFSADKNALMLAAQNNAQELFEVCIGTIKDPQILKLIKPHLEKYAENNKADIFLKLLERQLLIFEEKQLFQNILAKQSEKTKPLSAQPPTVSNPFAIVPKRNKYKI